MKIVQSKHIENRPAFCTFGLCHWQLFWMSDLENCIENIIPLHKMDQYRNEYSYYKLNRRKSKSARRAIKSDRKNKFGRIAIPSRKTISTRGVEYTARQSPMDGQPTSDIKHS